MSSVVPIGAMVVLPTIEVTTGEREMGLVVVGRDPGEEGQVRENLEGSGRRSVEGSVRGGE